MHDDTSSLRLLAEIREAIEEPVDPHQGLQTILSKLNSSGGLIRGTVALVRRDTREISVDASCNVGDPLPSRFDPNHGIAREVIATGQAALLPRANDEPEDVAFLSVPIRIDSEVVGALSADHHPSSTPQLDQALQTFAIVARMIAPNVAARQARLETHPPEPLTRTRIVARAKAMKPVAQMIETVAASDATVLIRGESGTGKELVADAIHSLSRRREMPLIKVNCAALADGVLESELFGHEAGAFTGATQLRIGRFEMAHGGTIFLDEIGDFSPSTQVTLLRILQEQTFERVGGCQTLKADVRVVAATNRDLESLMSDQKFRQDLYYRLNVFPIHVPPLRERRTDILLLADTFVERFSRALNKDVRRISSEAIDLLMAYHWPGNVRELENCIERAMLLTRDGVIHAHHLPPTLQTPASSGTSPKGTLISTIEAVERELLIDALKDSRGNMAEAARKLGVTERQMGLRVRKYGFTPRKFRGRS